MTRVKLIDTSKPHWASRRFTMDGVEYQQNETVDVSKLDGRTAKRLIKYRYVTDIKPSDVAAVEPVKTDPPPPKNPHKVVEPEVKSDGPVGKLVHVNGGQYEVQDADGVNLLPERVKGKDMARMAAGQMGITIAE